MSAATIALAGAGLLALLGGALIAHRRTGDGLREMAPALISAAAVAAYLGALWGRRSRDRKPRHRWTATWLEGRPH
jgi:membrane associated rhomboid family serine protease